MKKVLIIAIVALLTTATLFAGVNFSGRFRQGYTFSFGEKTTISPWKTEEAKLVIKATDDNGLWTVNLKATGALDSNDAWAANASFDLTKALALGGIDTGDFGLAISLGHNSKMTALSAYTDPTGNEYFKLKNNGKESMQIAMSYGNLIGFNVAFDPTTMIGDDKNDPSLVLSAKTEPMNGLALAVAYAYNGYYADAIDGADTTAKHMVGVSADVNMAKLVGLDFKLGLTAYDNIAIDGKNSFATAVYGGVDLIDAFVEFTMINADKVNTFGLNTQVNLNLVENLGLDVYFNIANLEKTADTFAVGGDVSYVLAGTGVEFALNAEYASKDQTFGITPKMIIVF